MADKAKEETAIAPDPVEDDLDDLDAPAASGPGRPNDSTSIEDSPSEDELAKQLQAGMATLIDELGEDPTMQKQFEDMMQELIAAGAAPSVEEAAQHVRNASDSMPKDTSSKESRKDGKQFQDTIRKTMERMQQSDSTATASSTTAGGDSEEELLAQMMKELSAGGANGVGEEDFNTMLLNMMTQLTNKEILYEPMKELHDKFPTWVIKNRATTGKEDLARYEEQQRLVGEIVGRFEKAGYSDENEADREYIVERMQKMQAAGSPPSDLVGDMSAAQEALGDLDAGCPTQ